MASNKPTLPTPLLLPHTQTLFPAFQKELRRSNPIHRYIYPDPKIEIEHFSSSNPEICPLDGEPAGKYYNRLQNAGLSTQGKLVQYVDVLSYWKTIFAKRGRGGKHALPAEQILLLRNGASFQEDIEGFQKSDCKHQKRNGYLVNFQYGHLVTDFCRTAAWVPSQTSTYVSSDYTAKPARVTLARTVNGSRHWIRLSVKEEDERLVNALLMQHTDNMGRPPPERNVIALSVEESLGKYFHSVDREAQEARDAAEEDQSSCEPESQDHARKDDDLDDPKNKRAISEILEVIDNDQDLASRSSQRRDDIGSDDGLFVAETRGASHEVIEISDDEEDSNSSE